jgi:DNA-binding FadR family transcriptional regulator
VAGLVKALPSRQDVRVQSTAPYLKIAAVIRADIATGRLRVGDMLPSRAQLAARFDAAPMTVSNAVRLLKDEGLVRGEQGRGIFVAAVPDAVVFEPVLLVRDEAGGDRHGAVALQECSVCGALVRPEGRERHVEWHGKGRA